MNFFNNLNVIQKIILFIFIINFFIGIPIFNQLGLTSVGGTYSYFWEDIFIWDFSSFWWGVNLVLLIGFYLFKNNEK